MAVVYVKEMTSNYVSVTEDQRTNPSMIVSVIDLAETRKKNLFDDLETTWLK